MTGIEAMLIQAQLRWSGHVDRTPDHCIPIIIIIIIILIKDLYNGVLRPVS